MRVVEIGTNDLRGSCALVSIRPLTCPLSIGLAAATAA